TIGVLFRADGKTALLEEVDVAVDRLLRNPQLLSQITGRKFARAYQFHQPVMPALNRQRFLIAHRYCLQRVCLTRRDRVVKVGSASWERTCERHQPRRCDCSRQHTRLFSTRSRTATDEGAAWRA